MRYELQIVTRVDAFPAPDEVVRDVVSRGLFHPKVAASGGFDRVEDSPRLLLEDDAGARVLIAFERFAHASLLAQQLLGAPEPLLRRLTAPDLSSLEHANAAFRLTVVQQGIDAANAVRFQVQIADALVDRYGGVLVDPQMQLVWGAERWRADRSLGELEVRRHVVIHADLLDTGYWLHTHGLVKFGRPDLEIFAVPEEEVGAGVRILNEIAERSMSGEELRAGDRIELGAARVRLAAGGQHTPNDFDNTCLRVEDDAPGKGGPGAPMAIAARREG